MPEWIPLRSEAEILRIQERSRQVPCLIFKHSTRCNISSIARFRLEDDWSFGPQEMEAYYLDLIQHRSVSNAVAETFQVYHESPQVLLIVEGECIYDASHLDVQVEEIKEVLTGIRP
ncbi:MAG: bacillithiol system redox-active protein YtxJ [Saprospiraceae bacterium]|nr:bacillithiol system redox-active protein YtxJ [Saprospiraceae bacterium]